MANQNPQNSLIPSPIHRRSSFHDWTLVGRTKADQKQHEFNEMKNRLAKMEVILAKLQTKTISKAEHEAQIAEIEEICESKIAMYEEQINQFKESYDSKFAELKKEFLKTQDQCDSNFFEMAEIRVKEETELTSKIHDLHLVNARLYKTVSELIDEVQTLKADAHQMQTQIAKYKNDAEC